MKFQGKENNRNIERSKKKNIKIKIPYLFFRLRVKENIMRTVFFNPKKGGGGNV